MDAKQIAERQVIERYLAGQLSDAEAEAFEAYVASHPEIVREIELITRMKSGLSSLRERGELTVAPAERSRSALRNPALLAAAFAVAAIGLAALSRHWLSEPRTSLMATTLEQVLGSGADYTRSSWLGLARTRGEGPAVLQRPASDSAVELTLDLRDSPQPAKYSVQLLRIAGSSLDVVGSLVDVSPHSDGTLSFFVRGSALTPGNYLIRARSGTADASEFSLRVAP
jgi:hypothetical protein